MAAGWVGFIAENLILSHNRQWIIDNYGDDNYHIAYNILSTTACSSIAYGYLKHGKAGGPSLPRRGPLVHLLAFTVQTVGLIGLSQLAPAFQIPVAFAPGGQQSERIDAPRQTPSPSSGERKLYVRCPIDFRHKRSDGDESSAYGVERVTRHPALWFLGMSCLGTAMTTLYPTSAAMFSFPIVFSFIGGAHQDYRFRRGNGGQLSPEQEESTSNIPFVALIRGKQSFQDLWKEFKWTNAAMALAGGVLLACKRL